MKNLLLKLFCLISHHDFRKPNGDRRLVVVHDGDYCARCGHVHEFVSPEFAHRARTSA